MDWSVLGDGDSPFNTGKNKVPLRGQWELERESRHNYKITNLIPNPLTKYKVLGQQQQYKWPGGVLLMPKNSASPTNTKLFNHWCYGP